MAIHVALTHTTTYRFPEPVQVFPHVVRLRPAPHTRTPVTSYSLRVTPETHFLNWQQDAFGNHLARLVFPEPTRELTFAVDLVADLTVINPFDFFVEESAEEMPFDYDPQVRSDLAPYLATETPGPLLAAWLDGLEAVPDERTIDFLVRVNQRLLGDIAYSTRLEPGVQTPEETLDRAVGSCRDTGWLLVQVLRHRGLAARFVSGYLVQLTADEASLDGPSGPTEDFTDLHAWAEVYVPGAGWIGMDPTSGLFAGEGHIPLACTPSPRSAAPIEGATAPTPVEFDFANVVTRIHEDPRTTRPYDDDQWDEILALGAAVDDRLTEDDVRLTMGGEPTFVSVDDLESPQWTVAADGPEKRALAWDLVQRVQDRVAPDGLVQFGQGKWYPGEPLPRWQYGLHWRADGEPLWHDRDRLADPWSDGKHTIDDAEDLLRGIARHLDLPDDAVVTAYEDLLQVALREAQQPGGDPPDTDTDAVDPEDRAAVAAAVDDGAGGVGFVLPVARRPDGDDGWATTRWTLRRGRLVLVPGDSPIGLRLPLASLTWRTPDAPADRSTFEPRGDLAALDRGPGVVVPADTVPPTALTAEVRNGRVHVFLPPTTHLEHFVDLVGVVESVATEQDLAVVLEGYGPPSDPRLTSITVAPDPGVIEVNVHPTSTWDDLVAVTTDLYEDARQSRLSTQRFDLDGKHTGTGGGNHVTLGGATPADSPLLRRPDLLVSLLTYWQRHPSLSYLFSSAFIGATSQAPRVDEARDDRLHELDIAFAELRRLSARDAEMSEPDSPSMSDGVRGGDDLRNIEAWRVDRALRHLLTDLTGNTHRAEFCIDKLYSPDSERGRLGLLELRAFEMPPHPRMALVQALLVRSLVSWFWRQPHREPLVRWGSGLHDRFLLPWFVEQDVRQVAADLQRAGVAFDAAWFDPFLEFRFPRLGTTTVDGVHVELRGAIEPWDVLGEEATGTGTARYVDSSVERVQVLVDGLVPGRHAVVVNGRRLPLHPTGVAGRLVAGVRFKAWAPWSSLHPSIDVQAPLVIDVADVRHRKSLGGCTYHVAHPGGRNYDTFPVNANEAEARRQARFEARGHTPGRLRAAALREPTVAPEYPVTLDLRLPPP